LGNRLSMSSFPSVIFLHILTCLFSNSRTSKDALQPSIWRNPSSIRKNCAHRLIKAVYHTLGGSCYLFPSGRMLDFAYHSGIGCFPNISRCLSSFLRLFFSSLSSGSSSSSPSSTGSSFFNSASVIFIHIPCPLRFLCPMRFLCLVHLRRCRAHLSCHLDVVEPQALLSDAQV